MRKNKQKKVPPPGPGGARCASCTPSSMSSGSLRPSLRCSCKQRPKSSSRSICPFLEEAWGHGDATVEILEESEPQSKPGIGLVVWCWFGGFWQGYSSGMGSLEFSHGKTEATVGVPNPILRQTHICGFCGVSKILTLYT